jgi:simple sugar transport system permease protein
MAPLLRQSALTLGAVAAALAVGGLLVAFIGARPGAAYYELWAGGFGSWRNMSETLLRFCPLALCALAVSVGFRASFFTIGVEGQFYFGALAATMAGIWFPGLPAFVLIPLAMACGIAAGALWALVAGGLKVAFGVSEVIGTIMLNYIAVLFIDYLLRGPIRAPAADVQYTPLIAAAACLPRIFKGARLTWGILVPFGAAGLVHLFMERTAPGFRIRAAGANPVAAGYAGIDSRRSLLLAAAVSGGLAGAAGALEIQGVFHRLQAGIASDYGFTAIPIALVGNLLPAPTLVAALLFAALDVGATMMQLKASVPLPLVKVLQGLIILFVVGSRALPMVVRLRRWNTPPRP